MKKLLILGICIGLYSCHTNQKNNKVEENSSLPTENLSNSHIEEVSANKQPTKEERKKILSEFFNQNETKGEIVVEPKGLTGNSNGVYTYFRIKNGKASNLRLLIRYWSDKYIYADQYKFDIDGKKYMYIPNRNKTAGTSNDSYAQNLNFQWFDNQINQADLTFLEAFGNAKDAKLHLVDLGTGDILSTITFTENEKLSVKNTLEYYKLLDGATIPKKGKVNIRQ